LKQVPRFEIHEQQGSSRLGNEIAQRVEISVAAKIGNCQHIAVDADETWAPAAM
jgi:hypothetical protein